MGTRRLRRRAGPAPGGSQRQQDRERERERQELRRRQREARLQKRNHSRLRAQAVHAEGAALEGRPFKAYSWLQVCPLPLITSTTTGSACSPHPSMIMQQRSSRSPDLPGLPPVCMPCNTLGYSDSPQLQYPQQKRTRGCGGEMSANDVSTPMRLAHLCGDTNV